MDYGESPVVGHIDSGNPEIVALGSSVYGEFCADCHGINLEGQADWKVRLQDGTLPAPPHDETGHTWHHGEKLLFNYTKNGAASLGIKNFKSGMPVFEDVLSDAEIWAALSYIKSSWPVAVQERQEQSTLSENK